MAGNTKEPFINLIKGSICLSYSKCIEPVRWSVLCVRLDNFVELLRLPPSPTVIVVYAHEHIYI